MKTWFRLVRLPNALTTVADVLVGASLAGVGLEALGAAPKFMVFAALTTVCLYAAGMALNDLADIEKDRDLYPERPLPSAALSLGTVRLVILLLTAIAFVCAAVISTSAIWVVAALCLAIVSYDLWWKDRVWLAPLSMGACRALSMGMGVVAGMAVNASTASGPSPFPNAWWQGCVAYGYLVAVITFVSSFEDQEPDPQRRDLARGALFAAWLFPIFLNPGGPFGMAIVVVGVVAATWVLSPSFKKPVVWGLVVRNGVFTLVFFGALLAFSVEAPVLALAAAIVFPIVRLCAKSLAQVGS
ncbi:MAG: UbiA family prenyltransferase [Planctomycetota bacterium]